MTSIHFIFKILLTHLKCNTSSFFNFFANTHLSQPHNSNLIGIKSFPSTIISLFFDTLLYQPSIIFNHFIRALPFLFVDIYYNIIFRGRRDLIFSYFNNHSFKVFLEGKKLLRSLKFYCFY